MPPLAPTLPVQRSGVSSYRSGRQNASSPKKSGKAMGSERMVPSLGKERDPRGMVPSPTPKRDHGDPQAFRLRSEGKGELVRAVGLLILFRGRLVLLCLLPPYVDRSGVEAVLEVGGVVFLDHLDAGAAVLRDLINVRAFHET